MPQLTARFQVGADRPVFYAYLALLLWLPLPLGSNRIWAWSIMEVWVLVLALAWLALYLRGRVRFSQAFIRAAPVTICLALIAVWTVLQTLVLPANLLGVLSARALDLHTLTQTDTRVSLNVYATWQSALKTLCYGLLFCLTLVLLTNRQRIRLFAQIVVLAGVFQAGYGALMALSGLEFGFFRPKEHNPGLATGTFVNRNHLAGYLEMCLAVGVGLMLADLSTAAVANWRESARRLLRALLGNKALIRIALVVMVIGLVLTRSRMGNTAFFVSLTGVTAFYLFAARRITRNAIIFFGSLVVIDLLVISSFFGIEEVATRLQETSLASEQRDEVALDTLEILRDFALTGTGAGSFYSVYPMYDSGKTGFGYFQHAHNDYLQFASELGLPALALLGFSVLASLWSAIQAQLKRRDRLLQGMGFAATTAIIALLIHSAVDFNLQIPANAAMFVVLMALAWICRHHEPVIGSP